MSEQIQAIIDRARALLTAATPGPWEVCPDLRPDIRSQSGTGGFLGCGHIATVSRYDANESDAALIAAAPELLAVLCDALDRAQFAAEWWAEERTIEIEALREAWAVMDSMARAAGVVGAFLEQAAPLLRPDVSGNVKAPNHVTVAFTDRVQSYEVTIRREGGKTPAEIIGELTARAESAERRVEEADELYKSIKAKVGQTPGDGLIVHDAIDALTRRAEEAEAQAAAMHGVVSTLHEMASDGIQSSGPLCDLHPAILAKLFNQCERAIGDDAGRALLGRLHAAEAERDEVVTLLEEIREFARMESCGPAVRDNLWAVKEMADTFIMRNAPPPSAVIVEGAAQEGGAE